MKLEENMEFGNQQGMRKDEGFDDIFDADLAYLIEPLSRHIGGEHCEVFAVFRKPPKEDRLILYRAEVRLFACGQNFYLDFFVGDDGIIHIGEITPIDMGVYL